jgi:hypothetical protein
VERRSARSVFGAILLARIEETNAQFFFRSTANLPKPDVPDNSTPTLLPI